MKILFSKPVEQYSLIKIYYYWNCFMETMELCSFTDEILTSMEVQAADNWQLHNLWTILLMPTHKKLYFCLNFKIFNLISLSFFTLDSAWYFINNMQFYYKNYIYILNFCCTQRSPIWGVHIYLLLPGPVYNSEGKKKKSEAMSAFPLLNIIDQIICLCPYKRTEKRV